MNYSHLLSIWTRVNVSMVRIAIINFYIIYKIIPDSQAHCADIHKTCNTNISSLVVNISLDGVINLG